MASLQELAPQLTKLLKELDVRAERCARNLSYLDGTNGSCPIPQAVASVKMTRSYRVLMPMAGAPWAGTAVDSVLDRLEIGGIRTGDRAVDNAIWSNVWQANQMDAMFKLGLNGTLTDGRTFATIWPDEDHQPEIVLDRADQMVVQYREGRHQPRHRVAALRRWADDDGRLHLTLYTATELVKLQECKDQSPSSSDLRVLAGGKWWEPREERGADGDPEQWPLPNPWNVVPVVEIATHRRLQPGSFPYARGEFEHCIGLLDRINLLTFLGLVVALWMGFPLRGVIGDKILRDDNDNPLPPFDSKPDSTFQLENPRASVIQLEAADRKNLAIFPELMQFAFATKTPAHHFPMERGISNVSAETITALDGALHAKVRGVHQPFVGEGAEEILRVGGLMLDPVVHVPPTAEIWWLDHEARSLAERADAATKLASIGLPMMFVAEKYLNLTQEEVGRLEAMRMSDILTRLVDEASRSTGTDTDDDVGVEEVDELVPV